jgi:hypothetical protein
VAVGDHLGELARQVLVRVPGGQMLAVEILPELEDRDEQPLLAREVVQQPLPGQARPLRDRVPL